MDRPRAAPERILVIQKNNIGDLVLATPLLAELRRCFPRARIDVLVNSYNGAVVARNPAVDTVIVHQKAKHSQSVREALCVYVVATRQAWAMRRTRYDHAFLLNGRFSR